jgi:hypothetical protein
MAIAKRFDAMVCGRIKSQNLTTSIQSEQPANFSICDSSACICEIGGSSDELPNTEPHACESGTGNTINNQSRTPPGHSEVQECDWIDALSRAVSVLTTALTGVADG